MIDWTKPLESAVDGTPLVFSSDHDNPDMHGEYFLVREDGLPLTVAQAGWAGHILIAMPDGREWSSIKKDPPLLVRNREPAPIDMLLYCPTCGVQHIDEPTADWDNPPHKSHLCLSCGCIWRPADVPTNGVTSIATTGKTDTWKRAP